MSKVTEIPVHCWNCGNQFYIEISNVMAGKLYCEECRKDNKNFITTKFDINT